MSNKKSKQSVRTDAPRRLSVAVSSEAYEAAVHSFAAATELMHKGLIADALARFRELEKAHPEEFRLADRARTFAAICERRLAPGAPAPRNHVELYHAAVGLTNDGRLDEAAGLLDRAISEHGGEATYYYERAVVKAMKGSAEGAAQDLRRAIDLDARMRYQASNDPDFEKVRDEAIFIDVIEPTPAGA